MSYAMLALFLSSQTSPSFTVLAYLDPGTGSFIIQLLIGGIVGAGLLLKTYWGRLKSLFSKNNPEEPSNPGSVPNINETDDA